MVEHVSKELGKPPEAVVADTGYYVNDDIKSCQEMGTEVHVARAKSSRTRYNKQDFKYEKKIDCYICPAGMRFRRRSQHRKPDGRYTVYGRAATCGGCQIKGYCTKGSHRTITRWEHEGCLERAQHLVRTQPDAYSGVIGQ